MGVSRVSIVSWSTPVIQPISPQPALYASVRALVYEYDEST